MSKRLEEELKNIGVWYTDHKLESSDVYKTLIFQAKAIDHLLWINIIIMT